jgi:hypothetical protein
MNRSTLKLERTLMNLLGALALIAALAAFSLTFRTARNRPWKLRAGWLLAMGLLSFPACVMALYYLHVLPEWTWFYTFRSWTGSEFCVVPLGAASALFATWLPRVLLVLPLGGFLGASLVPYLKPVLWPIEEKDFADHWEEGVCRQSTFSTCGPASLATILSSYRVNVSEREIAHSAHSYQGGTEAWYLARYARTKRMETRFVLRESFDPQVRFPAIVGVKIGASGHFIAVLDCADGRVTVADPLYGRETLSLDEFHKRYRFTGFHLVVASRH